MNNAVMLVKDRYLLTKQALDTFFACSKLEWSLTIVDDGSSVSTASLLESYAKRPNVALLRAPRGVGCTGRMRNLAVYWSEKMFGRGQVLYLSDNDACFTDGWDEKLLKVLHVASELGGFKLIGPYRHPYHHANSVLTLETCCVEETDAVQGIGHMMFWAAWDKYGPLDATAQGTNQGEDWSFCQRIVKDGFLVGSIQPEVVHNAGVTGTDGRPSPGADIMERIPGVTML